MAFIVEDGTGVEDANSYTSVAFADAYFADRNNTTWSGASVADKEFALVKAATLCYLSCVPSSMLVPL